MVDFLVENPTLLLFAVAGTGFLIGRIRIHGFSLGVAAVLFAGIGFGAIDPRLQINESVWTLGLAVFVYTVGLASGPSFVSALRRRGLQANVASLAGVFAGGVAAVAVGYALLGLDGPSVSETEAAKRMAGEPIICRTVRVTRDRNAQLGDLVNYRGGTITFSRLKHNGTVQVATPELMPVCGDLLSVIGAEEDVLGFTSEIGETASEHLPLERDALDMRRMFVSSRALAG